MTEKRFPNRLNNVIFIDTGKPNREEILEQLMNSKLLISDEKAFERYLIRKWSDSMIEEQSHTSAEIQYKSFIEMEEKLTRGFLREKTKVLLSLPIPMRYEVWSELHRYLERLE